MLQWEWYDEPNTWRVFMHLLIVANHERKKWRGVTIERGQRLTSLAHLAKETRLSVRSVRTALKHLNSTGEVTSQATSAYTMISVCNYETYQRDERTSDKPIDKRSDKRATNGRQATDKPPTTNKNDKNIKNDKNLDTVTTPEGVEPEPVWANTGKKRFKLTAGMSKAFLEFYEAYGFKTARAVAANSYYNLPWSKDKEANRRLAIQITEAASKMSTAHAKSKADGITPLHPATWLNGERWLDEGVVNVPAVRSNQPTPPKAWRSDRDEICLRFERDGASPETIEATRAATDFYSLKRTVQDMIIERNKGINNE
tara:strand:- start:277 stop:1218 length:942 start_codon:yes stop_codon:yes gene_type:complete